MMKFKANHDLHCHTKLSTCSGDPLMTPQSLLACAKKEGLAVQCVTDHLWDTSVPGATPWYAAQDIAHVREGLPLPEDPEVRMVFGCETEYLGGNLIGLSPAHFGQFDFIVVPPNHFHMLEFTRDPSVDTEEKVAELFTRRLEELSSLDLPWEKVGIAHLNCGLTFWEGDFLKVFRLMDEERLKMVFARLAKYGAGIELNSSCFPDGWEDREDDHLRLFSVARDMGCKFYACSDAHHMEEKEGMRTVVEAVAEKLQLTEKEEYHIPVSV